VVARKQKSDPKLESLKKLGTLNLRSEKVVDELFKSHDFFDPRDLLQVKYEMLRRVKQDDWSITRAAAAYGFSRPSFYEAQSEFEHTGLAGFIPEKRGPREAHKLSGEVIEFIEQCRNQDSALKTTDVVRLVKERFGIDVHRRSLERALSRSKKKLQK
jgi:transposase